jgi:hypothetical protein
VSETENQRPNKHLRPCTQATENRRRPTKAVRWAGPCVVPSSTACHPLLASSCPRTTGRGLTVCCFREEKKTPFLLLLSFVKQDTLRDLLILISGIRKIDEITACRMAVTADETTASRSKAPSAVSDTRGGQKQQPAGRPPPPWLI